MKRILTPVFTLMICLGSFAQDALTPEFKKATVEKIDQLINEQYVFPDVAKQTGDHLKKRLQEGYFNSASTLEEFAKSLTTEVQSINHDKHMRIRPVPAGQANRGPQGNWVDAIIGATEASRTETAGFIEAKKLEGNIGYLDFRYFASNGEGEPVADNYMKLLSGSDAIIIDMRNNGGGNPGMVQYICSYFFDKPVHLNSLYWRNGDRTEDFWSLEKVNGKKMPDVPLFILTSNRTFSGAEEFSYNMQTRKRATLIGETTGGGANPGRGVLINDKLNIFIPNGRAINPVTKTNWEGVGVVPEVKVPADQAYNKALELARDAAKNYREKNLADLRTMLNDIKANLDLAIQQPTDKSIAQKLNQSFINAVTKGKLTESDINQLGYFHLQNNKLVAAETIFRVNTEIFPNSANTYDSYGEALLAAGKIKASQESYQKAVDLATKNKDPQLEQIKESLKKAMAAK